MQGSDSVFSFRVLSLSLFLHFLNKLLSVDEHSGATKFVRMDVLIAMLGLAIKGRLLLNPRWICHRAYSTMYSALFILLLVVKLLNKSCDRRYRGKSWLTNPTRRSCPVTRMVVRKIYIA